MRGWEFSKLPLFCQQVRNDLDLRIEVILYGLDVFLRIRSLKKREGLWYRTMNPPLDFGFAHREEVDFARTTSTGYLLCRGWIGCLEMIQ